MAYAGQTITNPVTGERLTFRRTAADTNGELVVAECTVQPHGFVAAAHVHPKQDERFEILAGKIAVKLGKQEVHAGPGDVIVIPRGMAHKFWNAGDEELRFVVEVSPALQWEQLVETMYALAADGKTSKRGMPNPLRLAAIAKHHFDDVRLPFPPVWMQRLGLVVGAPLARLAGYRPTYAPRAAALAEV